MREAQPICVLLPDSPDAPEAAGRAVRLWPLAPAGKRLGAFTAAITAAWLIAGCSALPQDAPAPAVPDTSPALPTAVHVATITSDGIAGFFPFEGTTTTLTRADMRREETTTKGTGSVSRFLIPNTATATITRLDRKLVYALDIPRATYTECPLGGCTVPSTPQQPARGQPEQPRSSRESGCTMKVASNTFNVKPTSQRKAVNGFDTEQYVVDWRVTLEDPTKRRSTLQLTIDLWTTPVSPAMRDAMALESRFGRAAAASVDRSAALPPQFMEMMNRYFAQSMTAAERTALFNAARQMERVKGQPVVTQMRLFYRGNACGGAADEGAAGAGGGAGALSGLLGGGSGNASGGAERPLMSFTQEVKSWRVEPARDSQFSPPPQFKRSNPG